MIMSLMNALLPVIALVILPTFMPLYLLFKLIRRIKAAIFSENVAGKVVLITGASSGIGEYVAYEYARRGARLVLAARREDRLHAVAKKAQNMGSRAVIVVRADVSKIEDCRRCVDEAVNHFGQLDHLINNAGIAPSSMFEHSNYTSNSAFTMDVNFWGSVHCSHFALPYLKKSKGKIVGIASIAAWLTMPKLSSYSASKAALISFYETLRAECGSHIGITIVTPGLIQSEITTPDFLAEFGVQFAPMESTEVFAKAVVDSACRGDCYLTVPSHVRVLLWLKMLYPELFEWLLKSINKQSYYKKEA